MLKLIILGLVVGWLLRSLLRPVRQPLATPPEIEKMLRCRYCGVHFPESERVEGPAGDYCSRAHRDKHLGG